MAVQAEIEVPVAEVELVVINNHLRFPFLHPQLIQSQLVAEVPEQMVMVKVVMELIQSDLV